MKNPSNKRSSIVIIAMCWFSFFLYMIVGIAGYLQFGNRQCPLITNAYVDDRAMQVLYTVPLATFPIIMRWFLIRIA